MTFRRGAWVRNMRTHQVGLLMGQFQHHSGPWWQIQIRPNIFTHWREHNIEPIAEHELPAELTGTGGDFLI